MLSDTITAIATPAGVGGIGIVRISGPEARRIGEKLYRKKKRRLFSESAQFGFAPRKLYYGYVVDPTTNSVVDEVLMALMSAPNSYTCEDVIEIQAHAGAVSLNEILRLVLRQGARLAEPGEFTLRAFINGRIDLTQAEAIIDVINAKTEKSRQLATEQLRGGLKEKINGVIFALRALLVEMEAAIDFPEEIEASIHSDVARERFKHGVTETLEALLAGYEDGHLLREGMRLVILGRPNVGKSSLMNLLLNKERAIVTAFPGTTRDAIEEVININGLPVVIVDTAGVRESTDPIESIGIQKAEKLADAAELILFMVDAADGVTEADIAVYNKIAHKKMILVVNKIDIAREERLPITLPECLSKREVVRTAVILGEGLDALKQKIYHHAAGNFKADESPIVPNLRQKGLIEKGLAAARRMESGLFLGQPMELTVIDLREALDALNSILGESEGPDILAEIFNRFCIGK